VHPLSPRSQIFGRKPSTNSGENNREGSLGPIPDMIMILRERFGAYG
jgi:hypothetical protein